MNRLRGGDGVTKRKLQAKRAVEEGQPSLSPQASPGSPVTHFTYKCTVFFLPHPHHGAYSLALLSTETLEIIQYHSKVQWSTWEKRDVSQEK